MGRRLKVFEGCLKKNPFKGTLCLSVYTSDPQKVIAGLPNMSDFRGKGPDADLFALQGPETVRKSLKRSGYLSENMIYGYGV